jgi:hypothetical protein
MKRYAAPAKFNFQVDSMGIGKSAFLRQFFDQLSVLAGSGLVDGQVGDMYLNRAFGIGFRIPSGWVVQDAQQTANSQAGNSFAFEDLDTEAFADYTRSRPIHAPFVTVADMAGARFLPEARSSDVDHMATLAFISFEGTWTDDGPGGNEPLSLIWWAERDLQYFAAGYQDFSVMSGPKQLFVSSCEAVEYTAEYSFAHADLPFTVPMRERAIYIHQGPSIHGVRMVDYPRAEPSMQFDYSEFVASLVFM